MSLLSNWKEILDTANLSPDKPMDIVSRWLPDADPEMLLACSWIFAPILTVQGVTGKECYFVAGIPISTMIKRIRLIA